MIRVAGLCAVLLAAPALAGPIETDSGCGGNAYSSAQVIEGRPPRKGPLVAVPDTLCADLDGPRQNVDIQIYGVPGIGSGDGRDPYEVSPRRRARPSDDR